MHDQGRTFAIASVVLLTELNSGRPTDQGVVEPFMSVLCHAGRRDEAPALNRITTKRMRDNGYNARLISALVQFYIVILNGEPLPGRRAAPAIGSPPGIPETHDTLGTDPKRCLGRDRELDGLPGVLPGGDPLNGSSRIRHPPGTREAIHD